MFKKLSIIFGLLFFLSNIINTLAQSISVSGPSSATVSYGSSSVQVVFYISYSNINNLYWGQLRTKVDGGGLYPTNQQQTYFPSSRTFNLTPGNHTIEFSLISTDFNTLEYLPAWDVKTKSVTVNFKVRIQNNVGGIVDVGGAKSSPFDITVNTGSGISASAIDQTIAGTNYSWNNSGTNNSKWTKYDQNGIREHTTNRSFSYTVQSTDLNATFTANLRQICRVNFANSSSNLSQTNSIQVNGTTYSTPTSNFNVVEQNTINAQATPTINGSDYIKYRFDHWSDNSTSYSKTFTINGHQTITAYYKGYATTKNVHFINIIPGQPICLDWDAHDNAGVTQYKVWRYPKYGATTCIATLGSSVTSFTDYEYVYSTGSPDATVMFYSVTAYYSPDQTWGEQVWINTSGEESDRSILTTENTATITEAAEQDIIPEYKLSNSPNPFNPTTQIHYSLPETEQVTIKVFNMLGKEVTELVNAVQRKGEHVVTFNADNLSSGVYIYTIQTPQYTASKKMILMK